MVEFGIPTPDFLRGRQLRPAFLVSIATLALAGCTGENSGMQPAPVARVEHARINKDYNIDCSQINKGVMLDCTASVPGAYSLYTGSYEDPTNKPLATYVVQVPHDHFSLIPAKLPVANCTIGYVTLEPAREKNEPGPGYQVFSFDIC